MYIYIYICIYIYIYMYTYIFTKISDDFNTRFGAGGGGAPRGPQEEYMR